MELSHEKLKDICEKYKIHLMILFGSYGTERFNNKSDIDIAIIGENPQLLKTRYLEMLEELSGYFDYREIDLILLNHADSLLKFNIATDGKLIYEKEKGLFQIFQVRAMSEHNDARKFYELDKKYIDNYIKEGGKGGKYRTGPPKVK